MTPDLTDLRHAVVRGERTAHDLFAEALAAADGPANRHSFIRRFDRQGMLAAASVDALREARGPVPPLAGLAVSIKDLFDVQGFTTTAASVVLEDDPPAAADCPAVARLRRAGAALVGHTNMTEFAYSGVGINPHHGTPANPAIEGEARIPGGSTSGGAVSVATGASHAALGSDTGGSIRIPAALQGLVGFKNTARLTPTEGVIPLSTTLDTACALTRSVRDAVRLHEVLADRRVELRRRPISAWRFAVPQTTMLDGLEAPVAASFDRALQALSRAGARIETIALEPLADLPELMKGGGFSPVEAWAWHRARLATDAHRYDPRVATRMRRGEAMSGADYLDLQRGRVRWIGAMSTAMEGFDAMLSPTVPLVAPLVSDLAEDDRFFATNALLLRNPTVVNMLDGCAISLPCHAPGELPVGLMAWSTALADDSLLDASLAIEAALRAAA